MSFNLPWNSSTPEGFRQDFWREIRTWRKEDENCVSFRTVGLFFFSLLRRRGGGERRGGVEGRRGGAARWKKQKIFKKSKRKCSHEYRYHCHLFQYNFIQTPTFRNLIQFKIQKSKWFSFPSQLNWAGESKCNISQAPPPKNPQRIPSVVSWWCSGCWESRRGPENPESCFRSPSISFPLKSQVEVAAAALSSHFKVYKSCR